MSLYNMLHGYEPTAKLVLHILNLAPSAIPRFRDAYITYRDAVPDPAEVPGPLVMVILTRTGGANRSHFEDENAGLRRLPGYIDDVDDEFDSTFALFRYELPDEWRARMLNYLNISGVPLSIREKTDQAVGPDQTKRQRDATDKLVKLLSGAIDPANE